MRAFWNNGRLHGFRGARLTRCNDNLDRRPRQRSSWDVARLSSRCHHSRRLRRRASPYPVSDDRGWKRGWGITSIGWDYSVDASKHYQDGEGAGIGGLDPDTFETIDLWMPGEEITSITLQPNYPVDRPGVEYSYPFDVALWPQEGHPPHWITLDPTAGVTTCDLTFDDFGRTVEKLHLWVNFDLPSPE